MKKMKETEKLADRILLPEINHKKVTEEIGDFVIDTIKNVGSTGCVIGLSGGVDSTATATIIKRAFDSYNATNPKQELELVAYILPSKTNSSVDSKDGIEVALQLGIRYEICHIEHIVEAYEHSNPEALENNFHRGNLTSRIRANVLNTKAATEKKIVAGTGNRDEDYGIGYYTLFGDGAVHMNPIGNLSKRLVRQMASYLGFDNLAYREPSAGLEPGQTDFKDLGYRYDVVELAIEGLDQGFTPEQLAEHAQVKPVIEYQLENYQKTYGKEKFKTISEVLSDIMRRHKIAESKAQLISPPVAPVTLHYK